MKVVLVGFMGSGKTTVSRLLGQKMNLPVTDLDDVIVEQAGPIPVIFETNGETFFRQIEHDLLLECLDQEGILATGGGTPIREDNVAALTDDDALVVLLKANPEMTVARVDNDPNRPLLKEDFSTKHVQEMIDARAEHYQNVCDMQIQTDAYTPDEIAEMIIREVVDREREVG